MKNQLIGHFRDIHVHAATIHEWNQDYSQLTAGSSESSLMQLSTAGCHVFREQINQRVVQQGAAPGARCACGAVSPCPVRTSNDRAGRW